MSMRQYTYIGAYAECVNPVKEVPVMGVRCTNADCPNRVDPDDYMGKFCGDCGSPTEQYQKEVERTSTIHWYDVSEAIDEALTHKKIENTDRDFWLANRPVKAGPTCLWIKDSVDEAMQEITALTIADHLNHFTTGFEDALNHLRKVYGEDCVTVKWGVVTYWM